jgi:hypothetical protein
MHHFLLRQPQSAQKRGQISLRFTQQAMIEDNHTHHAVVLDWIMIELIVVL